MSNEQDPLSLETAGVNASECLSSVIIYILIIVILKKLQDKYDAEWHDLEEFESNVAHVSSTMDIISIGTGRRHIDSPALTLKRTSSCINEISEGSDWDHDVCCCPRRSRYRSASTSADSEKCEEKSSVDDLLRRKRIIDISNIFLQVMTLRVSTIFAKVIKLGMTTTMTVTSSTWSLKQF